MAIVVRQRTGAAAGEGRGAEGEASGRCCQGCKAVGTRPPPPRDGNHMMCPLGFWAPPGRLGSPDTPHLHAGGLHEGLQSGNQHRLPTLQPGFSPSKATNSLRHHRSHGQVSQKPEEAMRRRASWPWQGWRGRQRRRRGGVAGARQEQPRPQSLSDRWKRSC